LATLGRGISWSAAAYPPSATQSRESRQARLGESIMVAGFPVKGLLSQAALKHEF